MTETISTTRGAPDLQHSPSPASSDAPLAEPLQLIALALNNSAAAKERFPNYPLTRLLCARLELDEHDMIRLADIIGDQALRPTAGVPRPFNEHLRHIIVHYGFEALFSDDGHAPYHHAIRPTGYDFHRDEVIPSGMERWRANYRDMSEERQMLAASIIWLYRAGKDNVWLRRVPCTWHAADAVTRMSEKRVFHDWSRLFALYPGW